jgi:hypothetical protein
MFSSRPHSILLLPTYNPLTKLSTHSSKTVFVRVRIGEESGRICHNLLNMKASAGISAIGAGNARDERPSQAAVRHTSLIWTRWVREYDAWRA